MKMAFYFYGFLHFALLTSCSEETQRYEVINKLRAVGFSSNPVAASPGQPVEVSFFMLSNPGETLAVKAYQDPEAKYAAQLPVTVATTPPVETNFGPLSLYEIKATGTVPAQEALGPALTAQGFVKLRAALRIEAGSEEENIIGDFLVYPAGSKELTWKAPSVNIVEPTDGAVKALDQNFNLKADVVNPNSESVRVGWFVNSGKVKNRRAKETTWDPDQSGQKTVAVTVRGLKSGGFGVKVVKLRFE